MVTHKILGFSYQKGKIRYSSVLHSDHGTSYMTHGSIGYDPELELSDLVDRWRLDFFELFKSEKPTLISSIEIWESKSKNSSRYQIMPLAMLAQCCKKEALPIKVYSPQAFLKGGPFGLASGTKPILGVDDKFGVHPPHWDEMQKKSVLVAWKAALDL